MKRVKEACYEAAIQSEAKPMLPQEEKEQTVIHSEAKPTLPQEEKEQAPERQTGSYKKRANNEQSQVHSVEKACYGTAIQSEAKPKRRGSSDAEYIQSEPPPYPPFSQEQKARMRCSRMRSVEENLLRSRNSVGSECDSVGRDR
jgi:hypothetical protein